MLPQQKTKLFTVLMATILMSLGSLFLMPLDVYASHSFEAGVQGDNIPANTHVDLSDLTLPPGGVIPLYDSSPNFIAGHFLYRSVCDPNTHVPFVTAIAGHIDESEAFTHVDVIPLYFIGHASSINPNDDIPESCVYHAHIPDPLNGGSPRVTDIDLVNCADTDVTFNAGDVVDINVQRTLGSIGDFYENNVQLPSCELGPNPVFDLNDEDESNDGMGHED